MGINWKPAWPMKFVALERKKRKGLFDEFLPEGVVQMERKKRVRNGNLEKIFNALSISSPTNGELAKLIYGVDNSTTRARIRPQLTEIRRTYNVTIIPSSSGRYTMSKIYTEYDETFFQNRVVLSKLGRPRKVA